MRRSVRRACRENDGNILFLRSRENRPCICIKVLGDPLYDASGSGQPRQPSRRITWKWVDLNELEGSAFITYREKIAEHIRVLQEIKRGKRKTIIEKEIIYAPPLMERAFLRQIFNNHLTTEDKQRYIVEFSNTIIGSQTCYTCLQLTENKRKCLHYECPGMCKSCYDKMDEKCPACEKEQKVICPICRDVKIAEELCHYENGKGFVHCGHPICWECLGKGYALGKPLHKCPICRANWTTHRVSPQVID